jgi:hypothetical protein
MNSRPSENELEDAEEFAILHGRLAALSVISFYNTLKDNGLEQEDEDRYYMFDLLGKFVETLKTQ